MAMVMYFVKKQGNKYAVIRSTDKKVMGLYSSFAAATKGQKSWTRGSQKEAINKKPEK